MVGEVFYCFDETSQASKQEVEQKNLSARLCEKLLSSESESHRTDRSKYMKICIKQQQKRSRQPTQTNIINLLCKSENSNGFGVHVHMHAQFIAFNLAFVHLGFAIDIDAVIFHFFSFEKLLTCFFLRIISCLIGTIPLHKYINTTHKHVHFTQCHLSWMHPKR